MDSSSTPPGSRRDAPHRDGIDQRGRLETARVDQMVRVFVTAGALTAYGFAVYFWWLGGGTIAAIGLGLLGSLLLLVPVVQRRTRSPWLAGQLMCAIVFAAAVLVGLVRQGYPVTGLMYLALVPLLAVFLLGRDAATAWTALAAVTCAVLAYLTWRGIKPLPSIPLGASAELALDALGLLGMLILVLVLARTHLTTLETSEAARANLADRLHASQRLESVGQLAGGVAHDFNNVLTVIVTTCDAAIGELSEEASVRTDLRNIKAAARRASNLTKQLLLFSRQDVSNPVMLNCNELIVELKPLIANTVREGVSLTFDLEAELWPIEVDRSQLEQVLLNLAANARDAMPDGGSLRIETTNVRIDAASDLATDLELPAGPYVRLRVTDGGQGMDAAVRERAFEPFFSTKPKGVGTGLGLASVYGIVAAGGGRVWIDSAPTKGTTISMLMPALPEEVAEPGPHSVAPAARAVGDEDGARTILLVEDDDAVRASTRRLLLSAGYAVQSAADADEALELFAREGPQIAALITDVMMPKMNGSELVAELRKVRPDLAVLFVTGYADDALSGPEAAGAALLRKPFSARELLARVEELLQGND